MPIVTQFLYFLMFRILISDIVAEHQPMTSTSKKDTGIKISLKYNFKKVTSLYVTEKHGDDIKTGEGYYLFQWQDVDTQVVVGAYMGFNFTFVIYCFMVICILCRKNINRNRRNNRRNQSVDRQLNRRLMRMDQHHVN